MNTDDTQSGIPTRAIHEAYLDMQRALKAYREAKDAQHQSQMQEAHGELQQSVLTFYELLRPHLRNETAVSDWWQGKLPNYTRDLQPPDPDDGKAIIQVQEKGRTMPVPEDINPDELETLEDWHTALGLNGNVRIAGLMGEGNTLLVKVHEYQKGLKHLDEWETKYKRVTKRKDGFMGDKREETIERQRIPIDRLKRAARSLADVAERLGALSDFDVSESYTQITDEQIDRLEEWRKENVKQ